MGEDASLDDFLGGESSEQSGSSDAAASADGTASTDAVEPDDDSTPDVEPAATTYAWDGDGAACGACGETVERRWQQGDGLVCPECKDWERA